jgi:hypothetical protein
VHGETEDVEVAAARAALAKATAIREGGAAGSPRALAYRPVRRVAIGDPQTTAARFFAVLARHGLLAEDGWLRDDVGVISMGDHFDIDVAERARAQVEGVSILGWLAAHAREQVTILLGNHDAARVMELATTTDERFQAAAALGRTILATPKPGRVELTAQFRARFPELPTPGYAARDYNSFTEEQRALVRRLLLARRYTLATTASLQPGLTALFTHAGVTSAQLDQLAGVDPRDAAAIAQALQARLEAACASVEHDWAAGGDTALSLAPLHIPGVDGQEGGGLLYHRPADPDRPDADRAWEATAACPRRFDPRRLPRGLAQVIGHTGHSKAFRELPRWREPGMDDRPGGLRTLRVTAADAVTYRRGVHVGEADDAIAVMIDPEMRHVASPADVELLELQTM